MDPCDIRVLIVEDELALRKTYVAALELEDFDVLSASSGNEAIEILKKETPFDFVLSDIQMADGDGILLLEYIRSNYPELPVIAMMSGYSSHSVDDLKTKGAIAVFDKPFKNDTLVDLISKTVEKYRKASA